MLGRLSCLMAPGLTHLFPQAYFPFPQPLVLCLSPTFGGVTMCISSHVSLESHSPKDPATLTCLRLRHSATSTTSRTTGHSEWRHEVWAAPAHIFISPGHHSSLLRASSHSEGVLWLRGSGSNRSRERCQEQEGAEPPGRSS